MIRGIYETQRFKKGSTRRFGCLGWSKNLSPSFNGAPWQARGEKECKAFKQGDHYQIKHSSQTSEINSQKFKRTHQNTASKVTFKTGFWEPSKTTRPQLWVILWSAALCASARCWAGYQYSDKSWACQNMRNLPRLEWVFYPCLIFLVKHLYLL